MTDILKIAVDRFLSWKLPKDFCPDAGISFKADYNEGTPWPAKHEPLGTNLFNAEQARAMFKHVLDGYSVIEALETRPSYATEEEGDAYMHGWFDGSDEVTAKMEERVKELKARVKELGSALTAEAELELANQYIANQHMLSRVDSGAITDLRDLLTVAQAEIARLREALQFYADKDHFILHDENVWDTVSGEPMNLWEDEANTATVEDGSVARAALKTPEPQVQTDCVYYLIECSGKWWDGELHYKTAVHASVIDCRFFTSDPNRAKRFEDAATPMALIAARGNSCQKVTEHIWCDLPKTTEPGHYKDQMIEELSTREEVKQEPDYRSIADKIVRNLEGRKQVIDLDFEEELVEEIMQEMTDTIREGYRPTTY